MRFGFGQVHAGGATDIGLRRAVNEDAVLVTETVFAVADGMGGHEAGDLASRLGIAALNELAAAFPGTDVAPGDSTPTEQQSAVLLPHAQDVLDAVTQADDRIREAIGARGGTTLCALVLVGLEDNGGAWPATHPLTSQLPVIKSHGSEPPATTTALRLPLPPPGTARYLRDVPEVAPDEVAPDEAAGDAPDAATRRPLHDPEPTTDVLPRYRAASERLLEQPNPIPAAVDGDPAADQMRLMLLNVGDSRGYRLRDGVLSQLTRDHSAVQELIDAGVITEAEAMIHPQRNLITRALGAGGNSVPDTQFHAPRPGDRYLLCTDGLTGEVEPAVIEQILLSHPERSKALSALIDAALASGGRDNISVLIVDVEAPSS
ncbi:PP2C family serine/threonine-protein phosphatase [Paeniglutamicibacter sp. Y32M11]|uniref:PP2C family protein-serine/threonine phosphatase n=1 Tax=Paeniglutamicibacter sp. Y32M11 TaxID=2853258 RepID=UPI001C531175|nr:serine/threonine-protein phosphatase [Paeniglutamicibacter sp. Y32M11]QXQ11141.1 hypothetical protein KUF55_04250 [Paeniglutamicibacter sp. Y32M11]